ncbi:pyrroline-5-carboxylate reductase [Luteolibacter flavescens]|uniref:Pyrroline-5-carboxylate reductase n=1 Tax=Luteolibacter flavescens TaxID=1859460 RepID=A0ABT3FLC9_9BACT|nr:pyrroline-5-carboxylate reductase [Luteolibacter flavescens]MCW1884368.1 pyrroline-5-carboxylate reductase [Luteolibacter flavescens]
MKLGVIGCGKMGSALVEGAIRSGAIDPENVSGCDAYPEAANIFAAATGATVADSIPGLNADVYLLCTKPNQAGSALSALPEGDALLISVAAGLTTDWLEARVPAGVRVIRCMPNTPALVGKGAAAFCSGRAATLEDAEVAKSLLGSVGLAVELPEVLMDAVTGLSGSGPAFIYIVIEAMADGAVRAGLPRAEALKLAAQTVLGAATMVLDTGLHPGELKDQVTSPGGTTIAGIAELEKHGVRAAFIEAVTTAARRSAELSGS